MLRAFFDKITRGSLRVRWLTIALSVLVLAAGVIALTQFNQELIPAVEFPQSVVLAFYPGADVDAVLDEVTMPIEEAVRGVDGVLYVESNTGPGYTAVIISSEYGLDQEAVRDTIRSAVAAIEFPAEVETPELLAFSMSDLPLSYVSVSSSKLSLQELKELVEREIVPQIEAIDQVARVEVSGGQELPSDIPALAEVPAMGEPTATLTATPTAEPTAEPTATPTEIPTATPTAVAEPLPVGGDDGAEAAEPVALPESWIQAAAAQNVVLATTADLTPEVVAAIGSLAPALLGQLTPEMLLAMPLEALSALPVDYLAGLDAETQAALAQRVESIAPAEAGEEAADDSPPLPEMWIEMAEAAGSSLPFAFRTAADLQNNAFALGVAELLNLMVSSGMVPEPGALLGELEPAHILWWAEQDPAFMDSLAPETIRLLGPEVQAVLPAELLAQLEAEEAAEEPPVDRPNPRGLQITSFTRRSNILPWWAGAITRAVSAPFAEPPRAITSFPERSPASAAIRTISTATLVP